MSEIRGRVAVVTGAASGIGLAIARRLLQEGASVAIADVDADAIEAAAGELRADQPATAGEAARVEAHAVDVSDADGVDVLAEAVIASFGRVDVLVNNAGVASIAPLAEMTDADWDWLLGVNLYGVIHGVRAFLPHLTAPGGHILNTGSMAGLSPDAGMGGYGVSKFAITAYTEVLAEELADTGIGVTLLAPGPVRTRLGASSRNRPAGSRGALHDVDLAAGDGGGLRWASPEDAAEAAIAAIRTGSRYAITHPDWKDVVVRRHRRIEAAFD